MPVRDAMETGERPSAIVVPRGGRAGYCAYCEGLDNKRRRCRSRCPGWRCWLWLWLLLAGLLLSGPSWLVGQAGCWFSAAATHTQPGPASQCVCWLAPANQANQTPVRAKPTLGAAMAAQLHHAFPCCSSEQQCARRAPLRLNRVPSQSRRLDSFRIRNSSERFSSSGIFLLSVSARCQKNRALNWDLQGPIVLFILWHCARAFFEQQCAIVQYQCLQCRIYPPSLASLASCWWEPRPPLAAALAGHGARATIQCPSVMSAGWLNQDVHETRWVRNRLDIEGH